MLPAPTPPVTFAVCVEAGGFEAMSLRAVQSLRRFGGRFARCPVVAVTPRFGPRLSRVTRAGFDQLDTDYVAIRPREKYGWYPYLNKPLTVLAAQARTDSPVVCYLDSDMVVLNEPTLLDLDDRTDFAACAADKNFGVGNDPADENRPFWLEFCKIHGLNLDDLPTVLAHRENQLIRLYFNAGMFCYRKSTNFAAAFRQTVVDSLEAGISSKTANIYFHEQASLGLTAGKLGLRFNPLPHEYNYAVGRKIMALYEPQKVRRAVILHYHDMMWPQNWPTLLEKLEADRPDVHAWLAPLGPLQRTGSKFQQLFSKLLGVRRTRQSDRHKAGCRVV